MIFTFVEWLLKCHRFYLEIFTLHLRFWTEWRWAAENFTHLSEKKNSITLEIKSGHLVKSALNKSFNFFVQREVQRFAAAMFDFPVLVMHPSLNHIYLHKPNRTDLSYKMKKNSTHSNLIVHTADVFVVLLRRLFSFVTDFYIQQVLNRFTMQHRNSLSGGRFAKITPVPEVFNRSNLYNCLETIHSRWVYFFFFKINPCELFKCHDGFSKKV